MSYSNSLHFYGILEIRTVRKVKGGTTRVSILMVLLIVVIGIWIVPMIVQLARDQSISKLWQLLCNLVTGSLMLLIAYSLRLVYLHIGRDSLFIDVIDATVGIFVLIGVGVIITMISTYYEKDLLPRFLNFTRLQCIALSVLRLLWLLLKGLPFIEPLIIIALLVLIVTYGATLQFQKTGQVEL